MRFHSIFSVMAVCLLLASFDDSTTAEAIIRMPRVPDSRYTRPFRSRTVGRIGRAIIMLNNMHSSCRNGMPQCRKKKTFRVDCQATLISRKFAVTARHCFCHQGDDIAYTSGFNAIVGFNGRSGMKHKVKRTWVNRKCEFSCKAPGTHNACDYAVVELEKPVSRLIRPVRLMTKSFSQSHLIMMGYGASGAAGQSPKQCAAGKMDGKLRVASFEVAGTGTKGDAWGANKHGVLRYIAGKTKRRTRIPQGLTGVGDDGAPAFYVSKKGHAYLVGVHANRKRTFSNMRNPCAKKAVDEFARLTGKTAVTWLAKVVTGKTDKKLYTPLLHKKKRNLDQLPLKPPGSHQFPYRHQFGHRRRRHVPANDQSKFRLPGVNQCRLAAHKLMEPLKRKINLEVCGGMAQDKWPLEFFAPGFAKSIAPILKMQDLAVQWSNEKNQFVALDKNPYVKKPTTAEDLVTAQRLSLLNAAKSHFARLVLAAGKSKTRVSSKVRTAAKTAFGVLIPLEKKVKELKVKVKARKVAKLKGSKLAKKKKKMAKSRAKLEKTPRGRWKIKREKAMKQKVVFSFKKQRELRKKHPKLFAQHHSMRASAKGLKGSWTRKMRRNFPRPMEHRGEGYVIRSKRFNAYKFKKWKKYIRHYGKMKTHYTHQWRISRAAAKTICSKNKSSKKCKAASLLVKKYRALAVHYRSLRGPYRTAISKMEKLLWTPSRVARKQNALHPIKSPTAADRKFKRKHKKWKKAKKALKKINKKAKKTKKIKKAKKKLKRPTHFRWKRAMKRFHLSKKHSRKGKKHFHWMHFMRKHGKSAEAIVPEVN